MAESLTGSLDVSDLMKKPVSYEIERNYDIYVAKYEKEMHESYRLDIKLQDLNMQLERKTQKLRAKKAADQTQKIKTLEEKVYLKQTELSQIQESIRKLKKKIEKLRLDKLASKSQTQRMADFLIRTQSEASLHSKRRQKNDFKFDFHQHKIDELALTLSLNMKERSISTAKLMSERTSPIKKRFLTPGTNFKPSQTSAPITRILTKKWRRKTIEMERKLNECQKRVSNFRSAMKEICEHENMFTYDQAVLSFINLYEIQNKLERQLFLIKHEEDLYIDKKKLYSARKSSLIYNNITKKAVMQGIKNDHTAKLNKLKSKETKLDYRLELYKNSLKQAENVISEINSSEFNAQKSLSTNIFEQLSMLETGLNELMIFIKLSKKNPYAITGLLDLDSLHPKQELNYKIGNINFESADIDDRPLSLAEFHSETLKVLQYMKRNSRRF